MTGFAVLSTTLGGADEARTLARHLVAERLAACVQVTPVRSTYRWDGGVEEADEHLLACKIAERDFEAVAAAIRARHPYDVPEIVMTPITAGARSYLDWLGAAVRRPGE